MLRQISGADRGGAPRHQAADGAVGPRRRLLRRPQDDVDGRRGARPRPVADDVALRLGGRAAAAAAVAGAAAVALRRRRRRRRWWRRRRRLPRRRRFVVVARWRRRPL